VVQAQRLVEYPPVAELFDANDVKQFAGRRATYGVDPTWRPTVLGTIYAHQFWNAACWLQHEQFILSSDTGLGKTKSGLDALEYSFAQRGIKHALILTGRPISTVEWVEQCEKYIRIPIQDVTGTTAERRDQLLRFPSAPIMVSDYASMVHCFSTRANKAGRTSTGKKKTHLVPDLTLCSHFGRQFDAIILDELHNLKNPATTRFEVVQALIPEIRIRYGLTGTLFDRHPEDAWAQFFLIDNGVCLGNRHDFLHYFFDEKPSFWSKWAVDYKIKPERKDELKRRIRSRCLRVSLAEVKDVPPMSIFPVNLKASLEQRARIIETQRQMKQAREKEESLNTFSALRQLVSGLVRIKTAAIDDTIRLKDNPKLEWTLHLLDDLDPKEQVVIFYEFRASGSWLNEALIDAKEKVSWLYGGMPGDENAILANWKAKKTRILLTQTQKAAESLNLQQAAYLVQYESPMTYRLEKQSLARVGGRIGGRPSIGYKLAIRGCVEQRIMALIREGMVLSHDLLETLEEEPL
jgi:SNF2 family DNA or RNA helicase